MNAGLFQCVTQLGIQHDAVVLGVSQGIGVPHRGLRAGIVIFYQMQSKGQISLLNRIGEGCAVFVPLLHLPDMNDILLRDKTVVQRILVG